MVLTHPIVIIVGVVMAVAFQAAVNGDSLPDWCTDGVISLPKIDATETSFIPVWVSTTVNIITGVADTIIVTVTFIACAASYLVVPVGSFEEAPVLVSVIYYLLTRGLLIYSLVRLWQGGG